jgi:hypothetical protein
MSSLTVLVMITCTYLVCVLIWLFHEIVNTPKISVFTSPVIYIHRFSNWDVHQSSLGEGSCEHIDCWAYPQSFWLTEAGRRPDTLRLW